MTDMEKTAPTTGEGHVSSAEGAAPEAPKTPENKVEVTDAGPCRKKLSIEIPAEAVDAQIGESMSTLMHEAELPGFRKGRVPRRLIEKRFGPTLLREAKGQMVSSAYSKAVEDLGLHVIGEPTSEMLEKVEVVAGKPLAFEVEIEVSPEFVLPPLDGIQVRKPMLTVTDELVESDLRTLCLHEGRLESRESPEPGDYLTGRGVVTDADGKVHLDIADAVVQAPPPEKDGRGMILGLHVEDFGQQLGLPKPGETATIKTRGPEGHENEELREKDLTITFEAAKISRIIPAAEEDLVSRFEMSGPDELRLAIRDRIARRVELEQHSLMHAQIARHLLDNVEMPLPERVTALQAARSLARRRLDLMHRGVDPATIEEHIAELRAASSASAVRELKLFFILAKAAETLGIKVSDAEFNGRVAQMAAARNVRPDKLRQELTQKNQLGEVYLHIREYNTMDEILGRANITEVSAEEFNKSSEGA